MSRNRAAGIWIVFFISFIPLAALAATPTPLASPSKTAPTTVVPTPTFDPYGPQPEYSVTKEEDKVEGTKREAAEVGWFVSCDDPGSTLNIGLSVVKITESGGHAEYLLEASYKAALGGDWLFIESGESLVMKVDGKRMGFTGEGSIKNRDADEYGINEFAYYAVTKSELRRIARAKTVIVKLVGMNSYAEGCFGDTNRDYMNRVIRDLVDGSGAADPAKESAK